MKLLIQVSPISVPVGPETLGRIINVVGESIDEKEKLKQREMAYT